MSLEETKDLGGISVLLVEDHEDTRSFLEALLQGWGMRVHVAANAKEALQLFPQHENEISLIISDIDMPGMDGLTFLEELREMGERASECPAIAITGHGKEYTEIEATSSTFDRYVEKSDDFSNQLLVAIRELKIEGDIA